MAKFGKFVVSMYDHPHDDEFYSKNMHGVKTVSEAAREVNVIREVDVLVAGGGPGGTAAAVSAARAGADTLLIERFGHLGGMATGGLVNIIPNLGNAYGEHLIGGFCQELIDRLASRNAASFPPKEVWGKPTPLVDKYLDANMGHFYVRENKNGEKVPLYTAVIDPEIAKDELNTMVLESGAQLLLHTNVVAPIVEGNVVKGVILESKAGREAVLAKVVIDSTGDGDLLPASGVEIDDYMAPSTRIAQFGWVYWICNVDLDEYDEFRASKPDEFKAAEGKIVDGGGIPFFSKGLLENQHGVVWSHRLVGSLHQTDPEEMTYIDVKTRKTAVHNWELLRDFMPGFEKSFIMLSCPQLGTSGGRRVIGEYYLTAEDMDRDEPFEDTIAIFADNDRGEDSLEHPKSYVPYRALVPKGVDGFLVACRALSSDYEWQEFFNLIPHCMCFGQAAGAAAAIAVKDGVNVRDVDYAKLKAELLANGAILPE
ncbi:MAG: FAD-dependent oxidoreductase [Coriobacteriales bacterium]